MFVIMEPFVLNNLDDNIMQAQAYWVSYAFSELLDQIRSSGQLNQSNSHTIKAVIPPNSLSTKERRFIKKTICALRKNQRQIIGNSSI